MVIGQMAGKTTKVDTQIRLGQAGRAKLASQDCFDPSHIISTFGEEYAGEVLDRVSALRARNGMAPLAPQQR